MYTMQDFRRDFLKERFTELTPQEQEELLNSLPPETRLAGLPEEVIRGYLERLSTTPKATPRKPRRKKS